ncbi:MAG: hypothetical protein ACWA41_10515 [Putridiphycobacter sp.]
MNVYLTYDYELYFGQPTGTAQKCIIEPTNHLLQIADRTGVKMIFFIDVGYLIKLKAYINQYETAKRDYDAVVSQIKLMSEKGHDCQLHIHPHWEDCDFDGVQWNMNVSRYKLVDFSETEIERFVLQYKTFLEEIIDKKVHAYRAGGWCLQPFSKIQKAFQKADLKLDSTVFPGGINSKGSYFYDFTKVPNQDKWLFSDELCVSDDNGTFLEYPISNFKYSNWFFWRLFVLGRLNPIAHKPIGDGYPIPSGGGKKELLTKGKLLAAGLDGYFVTKMNQVIKQNKAKGWEETVFIGHPKACTFFALKKLEQFIEKNKSKVKFKTFSSVLNSRT